jgi:hypothetical protein
MNHPEHDDEAYSPPSSHRRWYSNSESTDSESDLNPVTLHNQAQVEHKIHNLMQSFKDLLRVQHEHTVHTADELASKKIDAISKELHEDMNEIDETLQFLSRKMIHKIKKQNKMIKFLKSLDNDLIYLLEHLGMLKQGYDASNYLEYDSDSSSDGEIDTLRPYEEYDELPPIENGGFLACRKHL